jgi:cholesterol transport system auxiliary component
MIPSSFVQLVRCGIAAIAVTLIAGCAALLPKSTPPPAFYSLDQASPEARKPAAAIAAAIASAPTLVVNPPHAAAGFDSKRILFVREAHKLEYFAHSEWVETPARMLTPLIVAAIENSGAFSAVVPTPSAASGDLRLETEILRLQQNFGENPSRVQFTLRAYLVDSNTRRVIVSREIAETVAAASDDPRGGVVAANRAVQLVVAQLANLCAEAAAIWQVRNAQERKVDAGSNAPVRR